jgi:hypothetical protein
VPEIARFNNHARARVHGRKRNAPTAGADGHCCRGGWMINDRGGPALAERSELVLFERGRGGGVNLRKVGAAKP